MQNQKHHWSKGDPYEYFMGRWSKVMAPKFLYWLNAPASLKWLDLGCGTGALSEAILNQNNPSRIYCVDSSEGFLKKAKIKLNDKTDFILGDVSSIPLDNNSVDILVSGLALNFFSNLELALSEMKRIVKPKGTIAAYVWDYSGRMDMLRYFWDVAYSLDPQSKELDEGIRFPICKPENLKVAFQNANLSNLEFRLLDIVTPFADFDDYWNPFLGAQGPAPSYLSSLSKSKQKEFKLLIRKKLPIESNGSIKILGRAFAIKGKSN